MPNPLWVQKVSRRSFSMSRIVENKFMFAAILAIFAIASASNAIQGVGGPVHSQISLAPDTVDVAIGPTMPPDPWEGVQLAIGPTMPPDPWEGISLIA
jgi:hypothetical protein